MIGFGDEVTKAHTNTIDNMIRYIRASFNPYNRDGDYTFHLALYLFADHCRSENVNQITKLLHFVANTGWSGSPPLYNARTT